MTKKSALKSKPQPTFNDIFGSPILGKNGSEVSLAPKLEEIAKGVTSLSRADRQALHGYLKLLHDRNPEITKKTKLFKQLFREQVETILKTGLLNASGQDHVQLFPFNSQDRTYIQAFINFMQYSDSDSNPFLFMPVVPERAVSCWKQVELLKRSSWKPIVLGDLEDATLIHRYEDRAREIYWLGPIVFLKLEKPQPAGQDLVQIPEGCRGLNLAEGIALIRNFGRKLHLGTQRFHGSRINRGSILAANLIDKNTFELVWDELEKVSVDEVGPIYIPFVSTKRNYR